jgi:arylformamidase
MPKSLSKRDIDHINLQYLPRLTVPNVEEYFESSAKRSARVRKKIGCELDIAYGDTLGQKLDVFPAIEKGAPVHIFIHGGYWRSLDKHFYSHVAGPMVAAGATVVTVNYDLCPQVRISDISEQMKCAVAWVYKNAAKFNGNRRKIYVSGHSAGGHLTGMLVATDWAKETGLPNNVIKGSAPLSGLFDIEPHRHSQLQPDIRLTAKEAKAQSPMYLPAVVKSPVIVAVGGGEPDLFHWQSLEYAARLRLQGIKAEYVSMGNDNHFDITDRLGNARDPLTKALIAQMGL